MRDTTVTILRGNYKLEVTFSQSAMSTRSRYEVLLLQTVTEDLSLTAEEETRIEMMMSRPFAHNNDQH